MAVSIDPSGRVHVLFIWKSLPDFEAHLRSSMNSLINGFLNFNLRTRWWSNQVHNCCQSWHNIFSFFLGDPDTTYISTYTFVIFGTHVW